MNVYLIDELNFINKNAGYKARFDVAQVIESMHSYEDVEIKVKKIPLWGKLYQRLINSVYLVLFLLCRNRDDIVIVNYPLPKPFFAIILNIKRIKQFRLTSLIHDVDILRGEKSQDLKFLKRVDYIVSHNEFMSEYLVNNGIQKEKIIDLKVFDYILDSPLSEKSDCFEQRGIVFAGNLSRSKSAFIYSDECDDRIMKLYGVNYDADGGLSEYNGSFDASNPNIINANGVFFGLVWDGESTNCCSGDFGEYLRYNNPHKTSLYLSLGIPVIIWKEAAMSKFIIENSTGIAVSSISEAIGFVKKISIEDYIVLRNNALFISEKIREGFYLRSAIITLISRAKRLG